MLRSLILVASLALMAAQASEPPPVDPAASAAPEAAAPPRRVVVRPDRFSEVYGVVVEEDDDLLVIRTQDGELAHFAKARILQVVHLVDPEPGRRGIVCLLDGSIRRGVIVEDQFERVIIEIEGIRTVIPRASVDFVELEPSFEERYRHFKATLDRANPERHFALCRWLHEQRRYDLAAKELAELNGYANIPEARELARVVDAQIALARASAARGAAGTEAPEAEPETEVDAPGAILSRADVNIIRVYEIDFRRPPEVVVPPETIDRLLRDYATNPLIPVDPDQRKAIYRAEPLDVVELMFKLRARELYPEIEVLSDPYSLTIFRQRVHDAWLMNSCATSACHGSPGAGRLFLFRRNAREPAVRYANLLTLERLEIDPQWPLVNYERPIDSLIIQFGLPRTMARRPHPPTPGWAPAFRRLTDRGVQHTVEWIEAMLQPRPEYPVEFEPVIPVPAEAPAEEKGRVDR
jgi:hypothetical protein